MTIVELSGPPPEALGRTLVVLEQGFVQTRYDQDSFARIASKRRRVSFGVTLGVMEAVLGLPHAKTVLEGEEAMAVVLKRRTKVRGMWFVNLYTDILPLRIALYLEPDVPDELGQKARRFEELIKAAAERKRRGLSIPPEMKAELEELNQIWTKARIFRKLINRPGFLKITVPTPDGMTVFSWRVEKGGQSLAHMIEQLHQYLHSTVGVLMTFENAVGLRDAIVQARAEGRGETQLRAKLLVEKEKYGNEFVARPFGKTVGRTKDRKIKKEYLDFLNKLTSGSFSVETMEKKSGRTVAFQGLLSIRTVFHPDTERLGL